MTIKRARKILGKIADNLTDEEIKRDIQTAEILKSLFFNNYLSQNKSKSAYNKNSNGKT